MNQPRPVVQLDKDGKVIATFDSIREAASATGAKRSTIYDSCMGRSKSCRGSRWQYFDVLWSQWAKESGEFQFVGVDTGEGQDTVHLEEVGYWPAEKPQQQKKTILTIKPLDLKHANQYVVKYHRHNGKVLAHRFSLAAYEGDRLCGVAIVANPVARNLDDGETVEVRRCCTDGTHNACSFLYGRCARVAKEMGFKRIVTYTMESESGVSLRASGWTMDGKALSRKNGWNTPQRPRVIKEMTLFGEESATYPMGEKVRWIKILN